MKYERSDSAAAVAAAARGKKVMLAVFSLEPFYSAIS